MNAARSSLCLGLVLISGALAAQDFGFTLDFEEGNLRGWRATGDAFASQPTLDDNPTARDRGMPSRHQGRWWIGTYERYQGRPRQRPGMVQGDGPTGTLRSRTFTCPGGTLSFLVGGARDFQKARVELRLEDQIEGDIRAKYATGQDNETMRRVTWDIEEFRGRPMHILIVDASRGGWGHINVDDFRFTALTTRVPRVIDRTVAQARDILKEARLTTGSVNPVVEREPPDIVVRQSPPPGDIVPVGSPVNLYVTRAPPEPEFVIVPPVTDMPVERAERILVRTGLRPGQVREVTSDAPGGIVVRQEPVADTRVPVGGAVDLVVSSGEPPMVEVPDVTGRELPLAEEILRQARLQRGRVREVASGEPRGLVLRQEPVAGTGVPAGSAVDLFVSSGEAPLVEVPDVTGRELPLAEEILGEAGLQRGRVREEASDERRGIVLRQDPAAGERVPRDSPFNLVVSSGPSPTVEVPDVLRRELPVARRMIAARDLTTGGVREREDEGPAGLVVSQDPRGGTQAARGSSVTLWVVVAPVIDEPVVPDVRGMSLNEARIAIQQAGLRVGEISKRASTGVPDSVVEQRPTGGERVPRGTMVSLWLASWMPWLAGGGALLAGAGAAFAARLFKRPPVKLSGVETTVRPGPSRGELDVGDSGAIEAAVHGHFMTDPGTQTVDAEHNVIEGERVGNQDD